MLVIGAENSSNSQRLVEVALRSGAKQAKLIADKNSVDWKMVENAAHIGISAGASAPEILVSDLLDTIKSLYEVDVVEHGHVKENMIFKLPSILQS